MSVSFQGAIIVSESLHNGSSSLSSVVIILNEDVKYQGDLLLKP